MKHVLTVALVLVLGLGGGAAMAAEPGGAPGWGEIAGRNCAGEWAALVALEPAPFGEESVARIAPGLDPEQVAAYDRFGAATLALAGYVAAFLGLGTPENQNDASVARVRARFELAMCLVPGPAERELILQVARSASDMGDDALRAVLFRGFDQFDCMGLEQASRAVFEVTERSEPYPFDFAAIVTPHMKTCG